MSPGRHLQEVKTPGPWLRSLGWLSGQRAALHPHLSQKPPTPAAAHSPLGASALLLLPPPGLAPASSSVLLRLGIPLAQDQPSALLSPRRSRAKPRVALRPPPSPVGPCFLECCPCLLPGACLVPPPRPWPPLRLPGWGVRGCLSVFTVGNPVASSTPNSPAPWHPLDLSCAGQVLSSPHGTSLEVTCRGLCGFP